MPACSNCARTMSSLAHAVDHRREREQLPPRDFSSVRRRRTRVCRATLGTRARPAARLRRRCSVRPPRMQRRGVRAVMTALQGGISHLAGRASAWPVTRSTRARRVPPARRRAAPARPRPPTAAAVDLWSVCCGHVSGHGGAGVLQGVSARLVLSAGFKCADHVPSWPVPEHGGCDVGGGLSAVRLWARVRVQQHVCDGGAVCGRHVCTMQRRGVRAVLTALRGGSRLPCRLV